MKSPAALSSATRERYGRARARLDSSTAGQLQRRITELELMNQALVLSALALMLFIPALITLAALLPLGANSGLAADAARRIGLSPQATRDLQQLFPTKSSVQSATTGFGAVITLVFAYGWPAELKRGHETIWGLESRGLRDLWRPLVWLAVFFAAIVGAASSATLVDGTGGLLVTGVIALPVLFGWSWWSQHLLLDGRVPWRPLLPGAIALTAALFGMRVFMHFFLSHAIVSDYDSYGPIGVVFVLLTWFIALAVVMLGAPLAGHVFYLRRHPPEEAT